MVGDFNLPNINWDNCQNYAGKTGEMESKFVNRLRKNYLYQHIKSPTRYREKQKANVLDLVITNGDCIAAIDIQSPLGKSDHAVMEMVCILEYEQHKDTKKYNWAMGNYEEMCTFLRSKWGNEEDIKNITDVNEMWMNIKDVIEAGIEKFVPKIKQWKKAQWKHPVNAAERAAIRRKHRLWNRLRKTKSENKVLR